MAASISTWTCVKCTFINEECDDGEDECMMCQEPRKGSSATDDDDDSDTDALGELRQSNFNGSFDFSDLSPTAGFSEPTAARQGNLTNDSLAALGNMSFAAWESDRKAWTCNACTFVNEPRFLICGACGMAEGTASVVVKDELISLGLQQMTLSSAHEFLMKAVHKQLDSDREETLREERAMELLHELKEENCADDDASNGEGNFTAFGVLGTDDQKPSSAFTKAMKHVETLERIQKAEGQEHEEMEFTLQQWQVELLEDPCDEQTKEMLSQKISLERLTKEWDDRELEIQKLRMRLEGHQASV
eukprot:CAMPEP_0201676396 /NCGR_PEP_ID=MMETSP0494-20130426/41666_1 /ASSEMBLY_ACC=CAM_ASM_000839 /TAXON_ID=420259 /ORGANISM="Thalassiosira gravida, Strain GMp14c1" /LENGTH=303 /DNA_ID=CAMNT_0048159103 /DNA_START=44 /DNA_END=955 /DNA_ORIENTATION=+